MYKYVIIGAGFAGAVLAERIASQLNEKVLVIEKRNHIGGNAYDCFDKDGILIHKYGPHIFHTRSGEVWDYLSQFTEWNLYHHHVQGMIDGKKVPIPFNLNTLHEVFPETLANKLESILIENFGYNVKIPILKLRESNSEDLKWLADYIYEKVFLQYTLKQWGMKPEELDPTVTGRVPVYISRDDRYFQNRYQGMPKHGYTQMFQRILDHPNIHLLLNTPYQDILQIDQENLSVILFGHPFTGKVIYTGPIDEFFDYQKGELPYRSLHFDFETVLQESFQETGTVNYPNDYDFTRITEFKKLTSQKHPYSTIVKEFPQNYDRTDTLRNIPYYPIQKKETIELYRQYKELAKCWENISFVGRLAEYRYYDMDAVVARALSTFKEFKNK